MTVRMTIEEFEHRLLMAFKMGMSSAYGHEHTDLSNDEYNSVQKFLGYLRTRDAERWVND